MTRMMNKAVLQIKDGQLGVAIIGTLSAIGIETVACHDYEEFFGVPDEGVVVYVIEMERSDDHYLKVVRILKHQKRIGGSVLAILRRPDPYFIERLVLEGVSEIIEYPCPNRLLALRLRNVVRSQLCATSLNVAMKQKIQEMQEVQDIQAVMIESMATLAEYRDPETGEHVKRTQNYVKALAQVLLRNGEFTDELSDDVIELMFHSVPLHDIGKIGIRDEILLKPGRLTADEIEMMKNHTVMGYEAIRRASVKMRNNAFLQHAADVAYTHQEKYDGSGYPRGLKGDEIPLIGRLMAIADVYDALVSKRVYKEAMSHEEAIAYIVEGSGTHFDPTLVRYLLMIHESFKNISQTYADTGIHNVFPHDLVKLQQEGVLNSILIIDDSRIIRTILKNELATLGFIVDEAVDAETGLEMASHKKYDLVLTDVEMPGMNGYELSDAFQVLAEGPGMVIIMTASDYDSTECSMKPFGVDGLLLKPIDMGRLEKKILQIMGKNESDQCCK